MVAQLHADLQAAQARLDALQAAFDELFRSIEGKREEMQKHYAAIERLAGEIGKIEDQWANRMDRELPGWRDLVRQKYAPTQEAGDAGLL